MTTTRSVPIRDAAAARLGQSGRSRLPDRPTRRLFVVLVLLASGPSAGAQIAYGPAQLVGQLEAEDVVESSGLAASRRHPGHFWTHNDSGDEPRLFGFDEQGRHRALCRLRGAEAVDWEDMGSFTLRDRCYLFVADVGDNQCSRNDYTIYLLNEPDLNVTDTAARPLTFRYEDGPHDCEAVGLDTTQQVFILVEKTNIPAFPCRVYELPWRSPPAGETRVARRIGSLQWDRFPVPWVTGLDISPDGRRAVVSTYGSVGLEYARDLGENWQIAFAKPPKKIVLPGLSEGRRQGEAICYGLDGATLYLSSEKRPCPLFAIRPVVVPGSP